MSWSSAYYKVFKIVSLFILIPILNSVLHFLIRLSAYRLKRVKDKLHPCRTPWFVTISADRCDPESITVQYLKVLYFTSVRCAVVWARRVQRGGRDYLGCRATSIMLYTSRLSEPSFPVRAYKANFISRVFFNTTFVQQCLSILKTILL